MSTVKIAWIYPRRDRCGIALYSGRYLDALDKRIDVRRFDTSDFLCRRAGLFAEINVCDLVHIQYETSFFMRNNSDLFENFCKNVKQPVIITLHEVYRTFPDVFPRDLVRGSFITLPFKRILYDYRHPTQIAYRKHVAQAFFAKTVLVHQEYHKKILEEQHIPGDLVSVLPHPVTIVTDAPGFIPRDAKQSLPAHLVGCGYINPHYNYDLLFAALARLTVPWRFTWIGGVRRDEDDALLNDILHRVQSNKWEDRFQITGWLPEEEYNKILCTADVFCAIFRSRSSSGSIASAIGAGRPIVATALPLTEELAARHGVLHPVRASADMVVKGIEEVLTNRELRDSLEKNVLKYREMYNYDVMADRLVEIYKKCI